MNHNYEKHILQKFIVAVAFSIIRSKPLGQSLEEYVNEVRNKLDRREDPFRDLSISDSDFANCDEVNDVLDAEGTHTIPRTNEEYDILTGLLDEDDVALSNNLNEKSIAVDVRTEIESINILKDVCMEKSTQQFAERTSIKEVLDIFKDIDNINKKTIISTSTPNVSQSTPGSQKYISNALTVDNEITFCSFGDKDETNKVDNQNTELYTVHGYTDNLTHISQSQDINIVVPKKLFQNRTTGNNNDDTNGYENLEYVCNIDLNTKIYDTNRNDIKTTTTTQCSSNNTIEECSMNVIDFDIYTNKVDEKSKKIKLSHGSNSVTKSSDEYSYLFKDILNDTNSKKYKGMPNAGDNLTETNKSTSTSTSLLNELELDSNSLIGCNKPREQILEDQNKTSNAGNDLNAKIGPTVDNNSCKCGQLSSGYGTECPSRNIVLDSPKEIEQMCDDDAERSDDEVPEEIVTFKILEEMNRIKNYLNRQDRFSDSGRSSQGSQLSGARINESGFSLLNYLLEYPLIEQTLDIAEEVSRVLGEFVDKLHDDENYPQFVQTMLEKTRDLIKDIYEEDRTKDLLKKEDQINRLLLLNRSVNVNKYSMERIQPILAEVEQQLQKRELLELQPVKSENLCYVLHVLEVLLKRHNAAASSQASTQVSQDDEKSLKRSTITEIWRKKWNLSKSDVSEGSFKKRCVLARTSEALNRIIVAGMDGYSLISFAALQCFNLLQA